MHFRAKGLVLVLLCSVVGLGSEVFNSVARPSVEIELVLSADVGLLLALSRISHLRCD